MRSLTSLPPTTMSSSNAGISGSWPTSPDQVHLKVEFEIEDDGTELEIELTW
jgi:hypothetical protein